MSQRPLRIWPAAILAGIVATPCPAARPATLERARLSAQVLAGRSNLAASLDYRLHPAGGSEVPIFAVAFEPARLQNLRATWAGRALKLRLRASAPERIDGAVQLPAAALGRESITVRFEFEALRAVSATEKTIEVRLPLVVVGWPPRQPEADTFAATLEFDAGATVYEAFPADFQPQTASDQGQGTAYRCDLPVVPSLLRFSAAIGEPPLVTVGRSADVTVACLFVGLAFFGWRRFRKLLA